MSETSERENCYKLLYKYFEHETFSNLMLKDEGVTDFVRAAVYGTITYLIAIDHIVKYASGKDVSAMDPKTRTIVRFGCWQLLFSEKVPEYAAVSSSVELCKKFNPSSSGFVNAVLRKVQGLPSEQKDISFYKPNIACSLKPEVYGIFKRDYGAERALSIGKALLRIQPTTIRVNTLKITKEELSSLLSSEGFKVSDASFIPEALTIVPSEGKSLDESSAFRSGLFFVQGEGAMLASLIAAPSKGDKILDTCAAPGGKSTHMAQLTGDSASILSLDINDSRLELIRQNLKRLGITSVEVQKGDSTDLGASLPSSSSFDVVLCDVPCSGLGLMSGKPDIRHTISYSRIQELLPKQQQILSGASSYVKEGGTLVYSTCTLNKDENEKQVEAFLETHPDFYADDLMQFLPAGIILDQKRKEDASRGMITILPDEDGCEGFFVARLKRRT